MKIIEYGVLKVSELHTLIIQIPLPEKAITKKMDLNPIIRTVSIVKNP